MSDWTDPPMALIQQPPPRFIANEPCNFYFGNVCTGFGGDLHCYFCGWDEIDHKDHEDS